MAQELVSLVILFLKTASDPTSAMSMPPLRYIVTGLRPAFILSCHECLIRWFIPNFGLLTAPCLWSPAISGPSLRPLSGKAIFKNIKSNSAHHPSFDSIAVVAHECLKLTPLPRHGRVLWVFTKADEFLSVGPRSLACWSSTKRNMLSITRNLSQLYTASRNRDATQEASRRYKSQRNINTSYNPIPKHNYRASKPSG